MTIRRHNPRRQGLLGLTAAIDWFSRNGYLVSIPLNDSQPYDLIVEDDAGRLLKAQVKTTTARSPSGSFTVSLRTKGGNQSFHTTKHFDPATSDLLFVLTDDERICVFPSAEVASTASLNLCAKYECYRRV
jgi:hypothetical protein